MTPGSIEKLVQELRRRRVFRGIVVYGASTLLILEAADVIFSAFGVDDLPSWLIILLGIGFLGSLWFSWVFDFTPGGIVKTEPADDHPAPIPNQKLNTYRLTTFISVAIILGLVSFRIIDRATANRIESIEKSIAVLPITNDTLTDREARELEFIGHEITSCLLKVRDYRVIPWDDTRKYNRKDQSFSEIGRELKAALLVIWEPKKTRLEQHLTVDLISAADESLLWSEKYEIEEDWSGSEIFKCSRKISKRITRELRTFLTLEERNQISRQPISSKATMLTSMGNALSRDVWEMVQTGNPSDMFQESNFQDSLSFDQAIRLFTEAIKEDPGYAEAYANRAKARLWGIRGRFYDQDQLDLCKEDILIAFGLNHDLPEGHIAMGLYYYYGLNENRLAHVYFDKAVDLSPYDYESLYYLTKIKSTLGHWEEVKLLAKELSDLNPRNALVLTNLGTIFLYLKDYQKSLECLDRAIHLNPEWGDPYINKMITLLSLGRISTARQVVLESIARTGKPYYRRLAELDFYEGNYTNAINNIERITPADYKTFGDAEGDLFLDKGKIYKHAGKTDLAHVYYQKAIGYYEDYINLNPNDSYAHSKLGLAYAGRGIFQNAIIHGQKALDLIPLVHDAILEPLIMHNVLRIYASTDNQNTGLLIYNELLNKNSYYTSEFLAIDPEVGRLNTIR